MPGENCSILNCPVSRKAPYKGVGIYKVPSGTNEFESTWRDKLVAVVVRFREVDPALKERIQKKRIFICQRHFRDDQIVHHGSRTALIPGAIPELNLPSHSFQSPPPTPRTASASVISKRLSYQINQQLSSETNQNKYWTCSN